MDADRGGESSAARILHAARAVLAVRGLDATVDDVASKAGVNRRTVFRLFDSRDHLFAAAVRDGIRSYEEHLGEEPTPGADLDAWLADTMRRVHRLNAGHGRIYWEIAGLGAELDPEMEAVASERRAGRAELVARFTAALWQLAGGTGTAPGWLADACAVQLSAFATRALTGDFGRDPDAVALVCARTLAAAARAAVADCAKV